MTRESGRMLAGRLRQVPTLCNHGVPEKDCPSPRGCVEWSWPDYDALAAEALAHVRAVLTRAKITEALDRVKIGVSLESVRPHVLRPAIVIMPDDAADALLALVEGEMK